MDRSRFATVAGFAAEGVVVLGLLVSIIRPNRRFWPPGERSWTFGVYWFCGAMTAASAVIVGYLDRESAGIDLSGRTLLGGVLAAIGSAISVQAGRDLRVAETLGLEGRLYTGGIYRYTRNPQYVGNIIAIGGWTLVTSSVRFALLGLGSVVWHLLLPFAEEPWLVKQYGEEYETYRERVPRFVGWQTIVQLVQR